MLSSIWPTWYYQSHCKKPKILIIIEVFVEFHIQSSNIILSWQLAQLYCSSYNLSNICHWSRQIFWESMNCQLSVSRRVNTSYHVTLSLWQLQNNTIKIYSWHWAPVLSLWRGHMNYTDWVLCIVWMTFWYATKLCCSHGLKTVLHIKKGLQTVLNNPKSFCQSPLYSVVSEAIKCLHGCYMLLVSVMAMHDASSSFFMFHL